MVNIVGDTNGWIHLITAIIALLTGTMVLLLEKGTKLHKQIGYVYVVSMAIMLLSSFMIYRLFEGWGIFHYASIVSSLSIGFGMIPIWTKRPFNKWKYLHFSAMYWSVMGLYAAFAAEIMVRLPEAPFASTVGLSTAVIMVFGVLCFMANKAKWKRRIGI